MAAVSLERELEPDWVDDYDDVDDERDPDRERDQDWDRDTYKAYDRWVETHMGWGR